MLKGRKGVKLVKPSETHSTRLEAPALLVWFKQRLQLPSQWNIGGSEALFEVAVVDVDAI